MVDRFPRSELRGDVSGNVKPGAIAADADHGKIIELIVLGHHGHAKFAFTNQPRKFCRSRHFHRQFDAGTFFLSTSRKRGTKVTAKLS